MIGPSDPVPELPKFQRGDLATVVDAKSREGLVHVGQRGRILAYGTGRGRPLRFLPNGGGRPVPVDTPRLRATPDAVIVEPGWR